MSKPQMSQIVKAYVGAHIHDGQVLTQGQALAVSAQGGFYVMAPDALPPACPMVTLEGGIITPGFVDLQVNGGGGVMFNDDPSVATLQIMAKAHRALGSVALLPTLITDTAQRTQAAIEAVEQAVFQGVEGIIGLHLEGPHLSVARKGAHDAKLIRPMTAEDLDVLLEASDRLPNVMVTVAPENVSMAQIRAMAGAGITVSLGHTDADFDTCMAAFDAGATCVTHLFNAMSQLGSRTPGLVGAALAQGDVYAGLIADGIHVHPATIRTALRATINPDRIFLVTDAMATAGSSIERFNLNGRKVLRRNQRLTLEDGTLAGADLEMSRALEVMTRDVGDDVSRAVARATSEPCKLLRDSHGVGGFAQGPNMALYFADGFGQSFVELGSTPTA